MFRNDALTGPFHWRSRGTLRCLLAAFITCLVPVSSAVAQPAIEQELRSALAVAPQADVRAGVCVIDLQSGQVVFTENADVPLTPASTMKLFVMAAALQELGPEFHFETIFATDETDLFVIGGGDPGFGDPKIHRARDEPITADFERWADTLLTTGTTTIPGDLIIDESIFDDQRIHPSWEESDLDNWYAAPVAGLNFNDNCIDITVSPAGNPEAWVLVSFQPENSLVKITNKCRTGGEGTPVLHHLYDTFEYRVNGRCSKLWRFGPVSFPDPGLLFADSLRTVLNKKGIDLRGTIRRRRVRQPDGSLPSFMTVLAKRRTPLRDVLRRIGKNSQNLFAECLFKRIGCAQAKQKGRLDTRGSWAHGRTAIMELVEKAGINLSGLVVTDGSGLSRNNACTARQLALLLAWAHARPFGRIMHDSLSVMGVDGSLRKRLTDKPGRVYAKTGTMRSVAALAGYADGGAWTARTGKAHSSSPRAGSRDTARTGAGSRYAFALLFNGYKGPSTPYKAIQDRICRILTRQE